MKQRFNKLINNKMQLNLAIKISALFAVMIISVAAMISISAYFNKRSINFALNDLKTVIKTEDTIIRSFLKYSSSMKNPKYSLVSDKILEDHNTSIISIDGIVSALSRIEQRNSLIITGIAIFAFLQSIFVFIFTIYISHRIAGPAYYITKILKEVNSGAEFKKRNLRKNDEFKDLWNELSILMEGKDLNKQKSNIDVTRKADKAKVKGKEKKIKIK